MNVIWWRRERQWRAPAIGDFTGAMGKEDDPGSCILYGLEWSNMGVKKAREE